MAAVEFSQRQTLRDMKIADSGRWNSFAVNQSLAFISMSAHDIDRCMLNSVFFFFWLNNHSRISRVFQVQYNAVHILALQSQPGLHCNKEKNPQVLKDQTPSCAFLLCKSCRFAKPLQIKALNLEPCPVFTTASNSSF